MKKFNYTYFQISNLIMKKFNYTYLKPGSQKNLTRRKEKLKKERKDKKDLGGSQKNDIEK